MNPEADWKQQTLGFIAAHRLDDSGRHRYAAGCTAPTLKAMPAHELGGVPWRFVRCPGMQFWGTQKRSRDSS